MMHGNVRNIVYDNFRPYHRGRGRRFSLRSLLLYLVLPVFASIVAVLSVGLVGEKWRDVLVSVFSIAAGVLTGLLAVVQVIVGSIDVSRRFAPGESVIHGAAVVRLEVLRDLYANIAYTILVLLFSIPFVLGMGILENQAKSSSARSNPAPASQTSTSPSSSQPTTRPVALGPQAVDGSIQDHGFGRAISYICSFVTYFACLVLAIAQLHIVSGVYLVLDSHATAIATTLDDAISKDDTSDDGDKPN